MVSISHRLSLNDCLIERGQGPLPDSEITFMACYRQLEELL